MHCRITVTAVLTTGVFACAAAADIHLEYLGASDQGDGTWLHAYEGVRDLGDLTAVRDLHIEGKFDFEPGTITLIAPGDWSTTIYTGPGPILFNWQIESAPAWTSGNLLGFGIVVDNPVVTSTPFHWTDNETLPNLPDLGNVIATGSTFVPVPAPSAVVLLSAAGIGVICRRRVR